jgi:hypothetical protein
MCKTELPAPTPRCPRCQTDLSLLADFVTDLKTLLDKADAHRRGGEIALAVQAYLNVLEVDPSNSVARDTVGPALIAARTIERMSQPRERLIRVSQVMMLFAVVAGAFLVGYWVCFFETLLKR